MDNAIIQDFPFEEISLGIDSDMNHNNKIPGKCGDFVLLQNPRHETAFKDVLIDQIFMYVDFHG